MIRVGLRFHPKDAGTLRMLAERVRLHDLGSQTLAVFENAADAARTGEPLIVLCEHPTEAQVMADGYVRYGVRRPSVEELTGQRPAK